MLIDYLTSLSIFYLTLHVQCVNTEKFDPFINKSRELDIKEQAEINKTTLAHKEMDAQIALKDRELDLEGRTNENITTGYAGALYV